MGNALMKQDKLEEGIKAYQDSLVENRTREVEKKLKDAEKLLKEQKLKAYINPELAAVEKEKGNALVKEGKFVEAKAVYDEVLACFFSLFLSWLASFPSIVMYNITIFDNGRVSREHCSEACRVALYQA